MKKYALVFLSVFLFISAPFAAHANIVTATGRYLINAVKHAPGGAKVEATNTVTGAKHVIKHGVSSADLGKGIGSGIVGIAVGSGVGLAFQAITGLALDAVDWVLDPANNRIKYGGDATGGTSGYGFQCNRSGFNSAQYFIAQCNDSFGGKNCSYDAGKKAVVHPTFGRYADNCRAATPEELLNHTKPNEKYIPIDMVAAKVIELADSGNAAAQKDVEDYVTHIAQRGDLDAELDNSPDITKPDDPTEPENPKKECPVGTVRVGDICIALPDDLPDSDGQAQCGDCCAELIAILAEMAKMNELFYEKSLDNDAQSLAALNQINAEIAKLSLDFNLLLEQAKLTNQTLTQINDGQELHFNELKQKVDELKKSVEDGNALILLKLNDVEAAIKISNQKLDKVNENLEKINENLEKMQKCEGTELNQKLCEFMDWFKSEPTPTDATPVDVKEIEAKNSNKINMSGECPAPYELNFSVLGHQQNNSISYQPLCSALVLLKPIFIGSGALSGMFILMGYSRASNTGVNG